MEKQKSFPFTQKEQEGRCVIILSKIKLYQLIKLKDFVMKHATHTYTYKEAVEYSKRCF